MLTVNDALTVDPSLFVITSLNKVVWVIDTSRDSVPVTACCALFPIPGTKRERIAHPRKW